jgi:hypothetical protein
MADPELQCRSTLKRTTYELSSRSGIGRGEVGE